MIALEILGSLTGLIAILQSWQSSRAQGQSSERDAAQALSDAVAATQGVVARGGERDSVNYELTSAWFKASLAFRDAGEDELSRLCRLKGEYWTDPANWTVEQIGRADIGLKRMARELKRILDGK